MVQSEIKKNVHCRAGEKRSIYKKAAKFEENSGIQVQCQQLSRLQNPNL